MSTEVLLSASITQNRIQSRCLLRLSSLRTTAVSLFAVATLCTRRCVTPSFYWSMLHTTDSLRATRYSATNEQSVLQRISWWCDHCLDTATVTTTLCFCRMCKRKKQKSNASACRRFSHPIYSSVRNTRNGPKTKIKLSKCRTIHWLCVRQGRMRSTGKVVEK